VASNEQWTLIASGSNYQVVSGRSGLCLGNGGSTSAKAGIIQSTCGTATSVLWSMKPVGKVYQLVAANSNLCLTVPGSSQADTVQAVQSSCGTGLNQLWALSFATVKVSSSS
jgi:galactose oxidase